MKMMRKTEIWRCADEAEAAAVIENAVNDGGELTKKTVELKQRKAKGVVIEESFKVTTQVDYCGQWEIDGED